jgi:molybdopterin-guanine dinucleotide biosynthesis protein A
MRAGGIVLCGGASRRMGRPKHSLPFGAEAMLHRVLRRVGEAVDRLVVVAAPGQTLPELPSDILVVHDRLPDRGPLEGLAAGLLRLEGEADLAFATGCDAPLLRPAFIRRMIELAEGWEIAVPRVGGYDHPLAAVYRTSVLPVIQALLAADRVRPVFLFDQVPTRRVSAEDLRDVDPELESLVNVNCQEDYADALRRAGLDRGTAKPR